MWFSKNVWSVSSIWFLVFWVLGLIIVFHHNLSNIWCVRLYVKRVTIRVLITAAADNDRIQQARDMWDVKGFAFRLQNAAYCGWAGVCGKQGDKQGCGALIVELSSSVPSRSTCAGANCNGVGWQKKKNCKQLPRSSNGTSSCDQLTACQKLWSWRRFR